MLRQLSDHQNRANNIQYLVNDPVKQTQFNHPFYANRTNYPQGTHFVQPQCPSLPTPQHNSWTFNDLLQRSHNWLSQTSEQTLPCSLNLFFHQMMEVLGGLIQDLLNLNKQVTLDEVYQIFMTDNRLLYLGVLMLVLFMVHRLITSILN